MKTLIAFFICTLFIQCKPGLNNSISNRCDSIEKRNIEIPLPDTSASSFMHSPIDENKIWVGFTNKQNTILEFNLITKQFDTLKNDYRQLYCYNDSYAISYDPFDSIIWMARGLQLYKYDRKTTCLKTFPILVHNIIPKPDRVYLVSYYGFYSLNRKDDSLTKENSIPLNDIRFSILVDENTLWFGNKYTFNFLDRKARPGLYYDGEDFSDVKYPIGIKEGVVLLSDEKCLRIKKKGESIDTINNPEKIFITGDGRYFSKEDPNLLVPFNNQSFYIVNSAINKMAHFKCTIPQKNYYSLSYFLSNNYIWIYRRDQLFLKSITDSTFIEYPFTDSFKSVYVKDCMVYLLYNNKIRILDINSFLNTCIPYNAEEYENELKQFKKLSEKLFNRQTNQDTVNKNLKYLTKMYENTRVFEIKQTLSYLQTTAFNSVNKTFPTYYDSCYKNEALPLDYRRSCLHILIREYIRNLDVQSAVKMTINYDKYFGNLPNSYDSYLSDINSIKEYITYNDSLDQLKISEDSLAYLRVCSHEIICHSGLTVGEAQCYNYELMVEKLKDFIKKFPISLLIDNATFSYISYSNIYCSEGEDVDEYIIKAINDYKTILKKYPDTDIRPVVEYTIIHESYNMSHRDNETIRKTCQKFISKYPSDIHVDHVKNILNNLN